MSCTLSNGYTVQLIDGTHYAGGEPVRCLRNEQERTITVTDDGGSREDLAATVAEAVDDAWVSEARQAAAVARESSIEVLHGLMNRARKVPVIPHAEVPQPQTQWPSEAEPVAAVNPAFAPLLSLLALIYP